MTNTKRTAAGVDEKRGKVRVRFHYQGKRRQVVTDLAYTPANVKAMTSRLERIRLQIKHGIFEPAREFPNWGGLADCAPAKSVIGPTFGEHAATYLDACRANRLEASTLAEYESNLNFHWLPLLKDKRLRAIDFAEIMHVVAAIPWSSKTRRATTH